MAKTLYGAPVAAQIAEITKQMIAELSFTPTLAIVRCGSDKDDLTYEKSIRSVCSKCGVNVWTAELPNYLPQETLVKTVRTLGLDASIHGIILMCPRQYDFGLLSAAIGWEKDVDGLGFNEGSSFAPCTASAVLALLDYYDISYSSRNVTIVGRGHSVGAPLAKLLAERGAIVSVCHSKTPDPESLCKNADIIVSAVGILNLINTSKVRPGQVLVDVGINVSPSGKICGDIDPDVSAVVDAITPVPGGIGAITPYVLALHTVQAAKKHKKVLTNQ